MEPTKYIPQTCNDLLFYFGVIGLLFLLSIVIRTYSYPELFTFQDTKMRHSIRSHTPFGFAQTDASVSMTPETCPDDTQSNTQVYQTQEGLIGLIYPPRVGPLQTNREFPVKTGSRVTPFVAIYDAEPYLRPHNMSPPACS